MKKVKGLVSESCGSLMTLKEFKNLIKQGLITDYDGIGYYSDGKVEYDKIVDMYDVKNNYSHVVWYNR